MIQNTQIHDNLLYTRTSCLNTMRMRSNRNRVNNTSDMWSWGMTDIYMSVKSLLASLEITCSMEVTLRLLDMEVTLRLLDGTEVT